jgi:uncharacterized protein YndB with AHSA1/START domain
MNAQSSAAARGTLETRDGRHVLRYERFLAHPVARVWAALTEPHELIGWLARSDAAFTTVGDAVQLSWLNSDGEGNQAVARGRITELEPGRVLELDTDLHGVLRWELEPDGSGTRLVFSADLPVPDDAQARLEEWGIESTRAGWHVHLEHLEDALDGRPVDWPRWDEQHRPRWRELYELYRED